MLLGSSLLSGCLPPQRPLPVRAAPGGSEPSHTDGGSCAYAGWSTPRPLAGVPPGSVIRSPSLALGQGAGYVVGNDIRLFDTLPVPPRPLIAITDLGEDIGKPAGDFYFAAPRAFVDGDGTLHVVWAEPGDWRPVLRQDWGDFASHYGSLWHATYRPRRGWTVPERVYAGSQIRWSHGTGDMTLDHAGVLHGLVTDEATQELIYLTLGGPGRQTRPVPAVQGPVYSSIAVGEHGETYVAFINADRSVQSDANSVFLVRSPDGGRTWLPPQLISRSGERQATAVQVLVAGDAGVHLVWAQNLSGGLSPEVVRHVVSRDGGETWSAPDDADIPNGLGTLMAAVDRCGCVHIIHESVDYSEEEGTEHGILSYASWDGRWSPVERPFAALNSTEAALATDGQGSPRLVWSVMHPAQNVFETTFSPVISHLVDHR
jgi:hypothetical protein